MVQNLEHDIKLNSSIYYYGVNYYQTKPKEIDITKLNQENLPHLDVCFARYPTTFKTIKRSPFYLTLYLHKEIEPKFKYLKKLYSSYGLELEPLFYTNKDTITNEDKGKVGFYLITFDGKKLKSLLARYYVSLCIFMTLRFFSPGESYKEYDTVEWLSKETDTTMDIIINHNSTINNSNHALRSRITLDPKEIQALNDYKLINELMPTSNSGFGSINMTQKRTCTNQFMQLLKESVYKKAGDMLP